MSTATSHADVPPAKKSSGGVPQGGESAGRRIKNTIATCVMWGAFLVALIPLVWILWTVISKGGSLLLSPEWWSHSQDGISSRREGGGAAHAIQGTLLLVAITSLISIPLAVLTAVYLVEYGRGTFAKVVSFMVDILTGVPSIVAALFVYALVITTLGGNQMLLASSLALVLLMVPTIVRSTEEMLKLVPNELREASYALGTPKWKTITRIVLPTAFSGIVTGVLLGISRIMGETAPLLILTPYAKYMVSSPTEQAVATLPTMIVDGFGNLGLDATAQRVWATACTLILLVLLLNLIGRLIGRFNKLS